VKLKFAGLFLVLFLCFGAVNGFSQIADDDPDIDLPPPLSGFFFEPPHDEPVYESLVIDEVPVFEAPASALAQRHPIDGKLFEEVLRSGAQFKNLNLAYYLSSPLSFDLIPNREGVSQENVFSENNGVLVRGGRQSSPAPTKITINVDDVGILQDVYTAPTVQWGREIFEVFFPGKRALLTFRRDLQEDRFVLAAIMTTEDLKKYHPTGRAIPHLVILYDQKSDADTIAAMPARQFPVAYPDPPAMQLPITINVVNAPEKHSTSPGNQIFIEGPGTLHNQKAIVDYIMNNGKPAVSRNYIETLIAAYFREAEKLYINPDLAIAQMCYVTQFLRNGRLVTSHNYAGLAPLPGKDMIHFSTMSEGVRAHIQHLKAYANAEYTPRSGEIVNPRWDAIRAFRGTATTLDALAKRWSPHNPDYANNINTIIQNLRQAGTR